MVCWLLLESFLTRRPKIRIGRSVTGTAIKITRLSLRLVMTISVSAPVRVRALRTARLTEEPISVCSKVVSVVRRDMISPE